MSGCVLPGSVFWRFSFFFFFAFSFFSFFSSDGIIFLFFISALGLLAGLGEEESLGVWRRVVLVAREFAMLPPGHLAVWVDLRGQSVVPVQFTELVPCLRAVIVYYCW